MSETEVSVEALIKKAVPVAKLVHKRKAALTDEYDLLASHAIAIRHTIRFLNGHPDWFARLDQTKNAMMVLVDESWHKSETRATALNTLNRRITRQLPRAILDDVCERENIDLDVEERERMLALGKQALSEMKDNPEAMRAIEAVDAEYQANMGNTFHSTFSLRTK